MGDSTKITQVEKVEEAREYSFIQMMVKKALCVHAQLLMTILVK